MFEERKDDRDLSGTIGNFDLDEDFGVLESSDFDLFEEFGEGELIETSMDEEIELESFEEGVLEKETKKEEEKLEEISGLEPQKEKEVIEKVPPEETKKMDVIEPSTLVDEKLQEIEEVPEEGKLSEEKEEEVLEPVAVTSAQEATEGTVEPEETIGKIQKKGKETIKESEKKERGVSPMAETTISKEESMKRVLEKLLESSPDFEGAAVVSYDGFILTAALVEGADEPKAGAMSAAILSLGERACGEMAKGKLETVFVEGEEGYVLVTAINDDALLTLVTSKYAKLGLVFYELRSVKEELEKVLVS